MTSVTNLNLTDALPLTCSRTGTCCHGKSVWLNPWELAHLAAAKGVTPKEFRDDYCEFGGIRLCFNGAKGWKDLSSCSQYIPNFGCSVHGERPLACRLYPLGLKRQGEERYYIYQGSEFPCLEGCPEVVDLPKLTVEEYISDQSAEEFELAQDKYLEFMESLADGAFALLLESGLAESGDRETLQSWRIMGKESHDELRERIGEVWIDRLMLPDLPLRDISSFVEKHYDLFQAAAQEAFGRLSTPQEFREASILMMGLALYLGCGLGAKAKDLSEHWIVTAKEHGALE